jgi:tetratricopeptide (TPR) repeat protein
MKASPRADHPRSEEFHMPSNPADVEGVLLDVELLTKYRMFDRAVATLEEALALAPKNLQLREKVCAIAIEQGLRQKAIEHLLTLSSLYIDAGKLEQANSALLHAKRLNPQLSITSRLHAIREIEAPKPPPPPPPSNAAVAGFAYPNQYRSTPKVMSGDLSSVSLFDVVQVVENSRITGIITINSTNTGGRLYFNDGMIADAETGTIRGVEAFKRFADVQEGTFDVEKSLVEFKQNIKTTSNTSLILDVLRELDEERSTLVEGLEIDLTSGDDARVH